MRHLFPALFLLAAASLLRAQIPSTKPAGAAATNFDRCVVLIKGDNVQGTGFFVRLATGPVIITNLHVLAANPHVHIYTSDGQEVKWTSLFGAADRDLALLSIQDNGYSYLQIESGMNTAVHPGDATVTPGDSEGGEVTLNTNGKVLAIGPERIEVNNPIYHGNSGGPVIDLVTNTVIGVVTFATRSHDDDDIDKASFANASSAITGAMRYFSLRLDTVPSWQPYDAAQFILQTTYLKNFHENSRAIDSLLNGVHNEKSGTVSAGAVDSKAWAYDKEVSDAIKQDIYFSPGQRPVLMNASAARMDLLHFAQLDMPGVQNQQNFYSFEWKVAQQEEKYRKALVDELQAIINRN
jgi:hypothetical protein